MPQGDKPAYTDKQKRKAEHIEEGYEGRVANILRARDYPVNACIFTHY